MTAGPKPRYRVLHGDVVDEDGSAQEARDNCKLLNAGHDGDWESLRPELERLREGRKKRCSS